MARDGRHIYTLALDLDETLLHFDRSEKKYYLRPHCRSFLTRMAPIFEIVIFTAAD
jgi:CTD small phosphatase-like protein 2